MHKRGSLLVFFVAFLLVAQQAQAVAPLSILMLVDDTNIAASHADKDWWTKTQRGINAAQTDFTVDVILYSRRSVTKVIETDFSLNGIGALIIATHSMDKFVDFVQQANQHHIPIISFHTGTVQQAIRLNALMHISTTNYMLGVKAGERAELLGKLTFSCFYSDENPRNKEICKGFAFGISRLFRNDRAIRLPRNKQLAHKIIRNEIEVNRSNLLVTIDSRASKTVLSMLEQEQLLNDIFHVSMAKDPLVPQWIEEGKIDFAFLHQPWLESYLAVAAASMALKHQQHDAVDVIVGIRTHQTTRQRLAQYGLIVHYSNGTVRGSPGFIDKNNVEQIKPLWGVVW